MMTDQLFTWPPRSAPQF